MPYVSWSQSAAQPGLVLGVTFVCIAQTAATGRSSGAAALSDFNKDLIGVGADSAAAGLISAGSEHDLPEL